MGKHFEDLIAQVKKYPMKKLSVAAAADSNVLAAVKEAKEKGIADAILFGDEAKIKEIAAEIGMDASQFEIHDIKDPVEAAHEAVKLVHDGGADMYMKGLISSKDFLKSILDKEVGLRTGKKLSHVCVFEIKGY